METSYDVRIWKIDVYKGKRGNTYNVRWVVRPRVRPFKEPFKTSGLADSFRSQLVSAARKGEAFDLATGLPVSMVRTENSMSWFDFACAYVDMKWKRAAATSRRSTAEALVTVTPAMLSGKRGKPTDKELRAALFGWAFNAQRRNEPNRPEDVTDVLAWLARNTMPVSALAEPKILREALDAIATRLDGKQAAATVINRKRAVLFNALEYAVNDCGLLGTNPILALKWKAPSVTHEVDKRSVVNPVQGRTLLNTVRDTKRSGARLAACFACSYYSALRPEEAINLRRPNVVLPDLVWNADTKKWEEAEGRWGEFHLERSAPGAGKNWTDSGRDRDDRGLKHRAPDAIRIVPIPPELVVILRAHLDAYGTGSDGRLFVGERAGEVPVITYNRIWRAARKATFTAEVLATPLARTPYTLRHACVSTWLNGGVSPTQVGMWAGQSVEVLLKIYAACLYGQEALARQRITDALLAR
jgi:integrase